jgi:hypothetical protein
MPTKPASIARIGASLLGLLLLSQCGHAQSLPARHSVADDPTPSLPTYQSQPEQPSAAGVPFGPPPPPAAAAGATTYTPTSGDAVQGRGPIEPPAQPSENAFGYDTPIRGCFEGHVYALPPNSHKLPTEYEALDSLATLYACEWNIPTRQWQQGFPNLPERFEWFAVKYTGTFSVPRAGPYRFRIYSDDGSRMRIDGHVVVDNDGIHPPRTQSGDINLAAGEHALTLEYFQGPRFGITLQVYVTPPLGSEMIFTSRAAAQ